MLTGQDRWHANWKRDKSYKFGTFLTPVFENAFLPVAKWPDQLEVHAPLFGDWWRQSIFLAVSQLCDDRFLLQTPKSSITPSLTMLWSMECLFIFTELFTS